MVVQLTPAPAPTYQHSGQGHDRRRRRRRANGHRQLVARRSHRRRVVLMIVTIALTVWPAAAPVRPMPIGVRLVHSGLVMADPFVTPTPNRDLQDHYVFNGFAAPGVGWIGATGRGLDVGVRSHTGWAGWFGDATGRGPLCRMACPSVATGRSCGRRRRRGGARGAVGLHPAQRLHQLRRGLGSSHRGARARGRSGPRTASSPMRSRTDCGRNRCGASHLDRAGHDPHRRAQQPHGVVRRPAGVFEPCPAHERPSAVSGLPRGAGPRHPYVSNFKNFWVADAAPVIVDGAPPGSEVTLDTGHGVVVARSDALRDEPRSRFRS